jgi:hypothetical protein
MERVTRTILKVDFDYDFDLLALVTPLKGHRLCWLLNRDLGFSFARKSDIELNRSSDKQLDHFPIYQSDDALTRTQYFVLSNKYNGAMLIPEVKEADYFLMIKGKADKEKLMQSLGQELQLQAIFEVDPEGLKSREHLIFE